MKVFEVDSITVQFETEKGFASLDVGFVDEERCFIIPDKNLQEQLSEEELKDLKRQVLSRRGENWKERRMEIRGE